MIIKVKGRIWDIVWDEIYYESHNDLLSKNGYYEYKFVPPIWSNKSSAEYALQASILITKNDIDLFWENLTHKKVGKGSQTHITINTIADTRLFGTIVEDIRYYAILNIQDRTDKSLHTKALKQCDEWDKQIIEWQYTNRLING